MTAPMLPCPFGGRDITEWVARTPNDVVPLRIRDRIFARAKGRCHLSGRKIMPGERWELEHVRPLSMGGQHRESNLAPALAIEHRAKTAAEAGTRSKADRVRRKHEGTWPRSKVRIQSRSFASTRYPLDRLLSFEDDDRE
jgi:5-methylcytosine-specific restriction enzyme A